MAAQAGDDDLIALYDRMLDRLADLFLTTAMKSYKAQMIAVQDARMEEYTRRKLAGEPLPPDKDWGAKQ